MVDMKNIVRIVVREWMVSDMDLIDRQELIRQISLQVVNRSSLGEISCRELTFGEVAGLILDAPTVNAEPTRYGKWNTPYDAFHDMITIVCSLCGHTGAKHFKYCPHCGAKMG